MKILNSFLLFLVNGALHFEVLCYDNGSDNESNNNLGMFFFGQKKFIYVQNDDIENLINFRTHIDIEITSFDYYVEGAGSIFYWTSPFTDFWISPSERYYLYVSGRRFDLTCDENERCNTNSSGSFEYLPLTLPLYNTDTWKPRSLAIDYIAKRIYVVDTNHRSVKVMDYNGEEKATVFELVPLIPFEVVLDPPRGLMFVLAVNTNLEVSQIYRANMDGTESLLIADNVYQHADVKHIFSIHGKTGFILDTVKERVYFGNYKDKKIEFINYNGNERQIVAQVTYPFSISIYNNTLYWSNPQFSNASSSIEENQKCNFQVCTLTETGICKNETVKEFLSIEGACSIKSFNLISELQNISNPCETDNGGCQHQCLLKPSKAANHGMEFSCICNNGYHLAENLKNCTRNKVTHVYDQVVVPYDLGFKALSEQVSTQQIYPISRNLLIRLSYSNPNTVLYETPFLFFQVDKYSRTLSKQDLTPDDLLVSSVNKINQEDDCIAEKDIKDEVLRSYDNASISKAITYDWITQTLYFVKMPNGEELGELIATSPANRRRSNIDVSLATIYSPKFLTVHPYRGYIFAALHNNSFIRLNTDGTDVKSYQFLNIITMAIDFNEDNIYWLSKSNDGHTSIWYGDLEGYTFKNLIPNYSKDCKEFYMYVYGDHLYIKCEGENEPFIQDDKPYKNRQIYRYEKVSGAELGSLKINTNNFLHDNVGMKVSAKDAQFVNEDEHPCIVENGGCDNYCFGKIEKRENKLVKLCACNGAEYYTENNLKCNNYKEYEPIDDGPFDFRF